MFDKNSCISSSYSSTFAHKTESEIKIFSILCSFKKFKAKAAYKLLENKI